MHVSFTARIVSGAGRGKHLGSPTLNLDLCDVPKDLVEGVYATFVHEKEERLFSVMHYGPRPVFNDSLSCEVHLLDGSPSPHLTKVTVEVIERLRSVQNFDSPEDLKMQIAADIAAARAILTDA